MRRSWPATRSDCGLIPYIIRWLQVNHVCIIMLIFQMAAKYTDNTDDGNPPEKDDENKRRVCVCINSKCDCLCNHKSGPSVILKYLSCIAFHAMTLKEMFNLIVQAFKIVFSTYLLRYGLLCGKVYKCPSCFQQLYHCKTLINTCS